MKNKPRILAPMIALFIICSATILVATMIAVSQYTTNGYHSLQSHVFNGLTITIIALISGVLITALIIWTIKKYFYSELEAALTDLQNANNAKSEFLAKMSHEMRTPLNAVIGLSELILGEGKLSGESIKNLERVYTTIRKSIPLINCPVRVSRIN